MNVNFINHFAKDKVSRMIGVGLGMNPDRTNRDLVDNIEKDLRYIAVIVRQNGREILSDYAVTPPQFTALLSLYEDGDMTIGELSTKLYLACSTTTDLIDRMEKKNLVVRVKDLHDRRVVRISLLEEGMRVLKEVLKKRQNYLEETLKNFSVDEIQTLQDLLGKLHREMREE